MIGTLNKSKTALTINRQEFKLALEKIGAGIDKQINSLKKAKQSYDPAEIASEVRWGCIPVLQQSGCSVWPHPHWLRCLRHRESRCIRWV